MTAPGYREVPPHPALRPFVECCWCALGPAGAGAHDVLPDGCVDFLIDRAAGAGWLIGAMTKKHAFVPARDVAIAAVRFRPGGARAFVGHDLDAFTDGRAELALLGGHLRELALRALDARSAEATVDALQRALLSLLPDRPADAVAHALAGLVADPASFRVDEAAAAVGITRQHLAREVRRRTGLSPKELAAILRFRRACAALRSPAPLAAVAADNGYADQAHLARSVRRFAGATPGAVRRGGA